MANISYLSLSGETQGLISAGCSTLDSVGNKAHPHHCWQKHLVTMKKWQYVNLYSTEPVKRVFTSLIIK